MIAEQIAPGSVIRVNDEILIVDRNEPGGPPLTRNLHCRYLDSDERCRVTLPHRLGLRAPLSVLATPNDEGHYPRCGHCNGPWPCAALTEIREMRRSAEVIAARFEHEAEHPWPCPWCARFALGVPRRCKTERGLKQHIRTCDFNPNTWDLAQWVPWFDDRLRVTGGYQPLCADGLLDEAVPVRVPYADESTALAELVRRLALAGDLPATRDELDAS
jgi:hypothetical protein